MTITSTPPEVRPSRRAARTVVVWLLVVPGLAWAAVRLFGWERGPGVQLMAFTPYAAAGSLLPLGVALLVRKWLAAAGAALAVLVLAACVLPRAIPDVERVRARTGLHVMTLNLFAGAASPAAVVRLVEQHDVAVLAVQEFTPAAREGLTAAGLDALLPYGALADEPGTTGSGLYSRFPLSEQGSRRGVGGNVQAYATVQVPGAGGLGVESAHPLAPFDTSALGRWRADLAGEPRPDGTPILLGDFNSTLDHAPVRDLIARGYRDAADATGDGLIGTWGAYGGDHHLPPVTIDHVLVDERRIAVHKLMVFKVSGSDHRALIAQLGVA